MTLLSYIRTQRRNLSGQQTARNLLVFLLVTPDCRAWNQSCSVSLNDFERFSYDLIVVARGPSGLERPHGHAARAGLGRPGPARRSLVACRCDALRHRGSDL